jgi:hypothetical protein
MIGACGGARNPDTKRTQADVSDREITPAGIHGYTNESTAQRLHSHEAAESYQRSQADVPRPEITIFTCTSQPAKRTHRANPLSSSNLWARLCTRRERRRDAKRTHRTKYPIFVASRRSRMSRGTRQSHTHDVQAAAPRPESRWRLHLPTGQTNHRGKPLPSPERRRSHLIRTNPSRRDACRTCRQQRSQAGVQGPDSTLATRPSRLFERTH